MVDSNFRFTGGGDNDPSRKPVLRFMSFDVAIMEFSNVIMAIRKRGYITKKYGAGAAACSCRIPAGICDSRAQ